MKIKANELVKSSDMPFETYAMEWLNTYKTNVGMNTRNMYDLDLRTYILPEIGLLPTGRIVSSDLPRIINLNADKPSTCQKIIGLTAHIFRHNYCTMLYYSGISLKKSAELMGHANVNMIMEVYAHLDEEKEAVQEKLSRAIAL